jgi:hypothetical protein
LCFRGNFSKSSLCLVGVAGSIPAAKNGAPVGVVGVNCGVLSPDELGVRNPEPLGLIIGGVDGNGLNEVLDGDLSDKKAASSLDCVSLL